MFTAARLKLTAWYVLILTIITGLFSLVVYRYSISEVRRGLSVQSRRLYISPILEDEIMLEISKSIALRLLVINFIILCISGLSAYFLAGETLKPLEDSLEAQKRFVADASHELKTPLTALKTEVEVSLRDKNLSLSEAKKLLRSNLQEVDKLKDFTDYLMSLSRYEATGHQLPKHSMDLSEAASQAHARHTRQLTARKLTLSTNLHPTRILGNQSALIELISIILDNAIKYTPPKGTISLTVKKTGRKAMLEVTDSGIGISPEDLPHIFDRFYRADSSRSKTVSEGYGLGLSIAKSIVEAHSGQITATSLKGHTTFMVSLPA